MTCHICIHHLPCHIAILPWQEIPIFNSLKSRHVWCFYNFLNKFFLFLLPRMSTYIFNISELEMVVAAAVVVSGNYVSYVLDKRSSNSVHSARLYTRGQVCLPATESSRIPMYLSIVFQAMSLSEHIFLISSMARNHIYF